MKVGQPTARGLIAGVIVALLLVVYCGLYVLVRVEHFLVHERAITFDAHGHQLVLEHRVRFGDVGLPVDPLVTFFTPLRFAESLVWNVIEPVGKPVGLP
ncbi:MAG: hypothetical protein U0228_16765 [Myxococcaceae bacterium]